MVFDLHTLSFRSTLKIVKQLRLCKIYRKRICSCRKNCRSQLMKRWNLLNKKCLCNPFLIFGCDLIRSDPV
ncbi:hypothetical protein QQG55_32145 [Brugia pahangi]